MALGREKSHFSRKTASTGTESPKIQLVQLGFLRSVENLKIADLVDFSHFALESRWRDSAITGPEL